MDDNSDKLNDLRAVYRVEGKGIDENKQRTYDDVYMAYTIGLQWITKFTYLPDDSTRKNLVKYMKKVGSTVRQALQQNLKLLDSSDEPEEDEKTLLGNVSRQKVQREIMNRDECNAFVIIGAISSATYNIGLQVAKDIRRLIVCSFANGKEPAYGFGLSFQKRKQYTSAGKKKWYEQHPERELFVDYFSVSKFVTVFGERVRQLKNFSFSTPVSSR